MSGKTTPKTRYSLVEAARLAHMHTDKLGRLIQDHKIRGCFKLDHRYLIPCGHFDRWLGINLPAERRPLVFRVNGDSPAGKVAS